VLCDEQGGAFLSGADRYMTALKVLRWCYLL